MASSPIAKKNSISIQASGSGSQLGGTGKIVREGILVKRAIKSGRNWKSRYFVLKEDGSLSFMAAKGEPVKKTFMLGLKTKATVSSDAAEEFTVEGPTHDLLNLRAETATEAKAWITMINDLIRKQTEADDAKKHEHLEAYTSKSRFMFGGRKSNSNKKSLFGSLMSGSGSGSGTPSGASGVTDTKSSASPRVGSKDIRLGWEMKVGEKDNCFVEAKTLNYYKSKEAFDNAEAPIGKATLSMLV